MPLGEWESVVEIPRGAAVVPHRVIRLCGRDVSVEDDQLAVEEPLEIRLGGHSLSVTMRTPGHDEELVAGFLFSERIVAARDDLDLIAHYRGPSEDPHLGNVINVLLNRPVDVLQRRLQRHFLSTSSCGLCGKATIEAIRAQVDPTASEMVVPVDVVYSLAGAMTRAQSTFDRTGGLHAAGLFDVDGRLVVLREDVGRHNAVDKVIGHMVLAGHVGLDRYLLVVSSRASFEILQKALIARIPFVAAFSAASSLAAQFATACDMTLVGFLRERRLNVYSGGRRIGGTPLDRGADST